MGVRRDPCLLNVVDQWDEKTMHELINLVLEVYKDLIPQIFTEIKGIMEEAWEMKIELWPDVIP